MTNHNEIILIVEDDPQIRNFIAYALKQEGFAYHTAGTAQQAMGTLISNKIDLMILDLGLPDFDGMEVIGKVRSWSDLPILVVSARDQDKEKAAALCDIAIALSSKDTDNLVACQLCKKLYGTPKTVSILADPNKTDFFYQMGVDSVVCAVSGITGIIQQQAFIDEMTNMIPVGRGRVQIVEVHIPGESPVAGKKLWEISLPKESIVGCVLRGDTSLIPRGDTRILAGDTLVVIAAGGQEHDTVFALTGR